MAKGPEKVEIQLPPGMKAEDLQKLIDKSTIKPDHAPDFVLFKEWPRGDNQKVRVYKDAYKGKDYLNIRVWYQNDEGFWAPGKGVTFYQEEIESIIEGLQAVDTWCEEHPIKKNGGSKYD